VLFRQPQDNAAISLDHRPPFGHSSEPLHPPIRLRMESAFGADFAGVRIHRDAEANRSAEVLHANAFTLGQDIYFRRYSYAPESPEGFKLLAHELTHTLQQPRGVPIGGTPGELAKSSPGDASEREAEQTAERVASGATRKGMSLTPVSPRIQGDWLDDAENFASGAYDATATAVGDAAGSVGSAVSSAYDTVSTALGSGATAVSDGVKAAAKTVKKAGRAIGNFASDISDVAGKDAEQLRAKLLAKVDSARTRLQGVGSEGINVNFGMVTSLNQHISSLNAALPATAAIGQLALDPGEVQQLEQGSPILFGLLTALLVDIAAAIGISVGWLLVIIAAIILAIIALVWYFSNESETKPQTKPQSKPETKTQPDPSNKPQPPLGPDIFPICSPTGLTPIDAIPMSWFKPRVDDYYPKEITLDGRVYGRDDPPTTLPHGEPIGVEEVYWPRTFKTFQLLPDVRGPGAARFRAVLARYGFDWTGLQADHVQDIEFEGPDDSGFVNLWPMDSSANQSAGARTQNQNIRMCVGPGDPVPVEGSLADLKRMVPSIYGRFFRIRDIGR
jgi:hypothetical protein